MKKVIILLVVAVTATVFWYLNSEQASNCSQREGVHQSYFSTPDFYERAYEAAAASDAAKVTDGTRGIIVNHHLLAGSLQAQIFDLVRTEEQKTIVVLSPNHFSGGTKNIEVSTYDWETPFGMLENDCKLSYQLITTGGYGDSEKFFSNEHGVSSLAAFIKKSLPNSQVIPIALNSNTADEDIQGLSVKLDESLPQDTLVIASLDFSHDLPLELAEFHDTRAMRALQNGERGNLDSLDTDSVPVLKTLLTIMKMRGADNFHLVGHSNSAFIMDNKELTETTSYVTGYFSAEPSQVSPSNDLTIMYLGDIELKEKTVLSLFSQTPTDQKAKFMRLFLGNDMTVGLTDGNIEEKYERLLSGKGLDTVIQKTEEGKFAKREISGRTVGIYYTAQKEKEPAEEILSEAQLDYLLVVTEREDTARTYIQAGADAVLISGQSGRVPYEQYGGGIIIKYPQKAIFSSSTDSAGGRGFVIGIKVGTDAAEYSFFPYEFNQSGYFLRPGKETVIIEQRLNRLETNGQSK